MAIYIYGIVFRHIRISFRFSFNYVFPLTRYIGVLCTLILNYKGAGENIEQVFRPHRLVLRFVL